MNFYIHDKKTFNYFSFPIFLIDTKNSVGLVGLIEEVSHNAIAVYWNPLESSAKVSETREEHSKRFIFPSFNLFLYYYFN